LTLEQHQKQLQVGSAEEQNKGRELLPALAKGRQPDKAPNEAVAEVKHEQAKMVPAAVPSKAGKQDNILVSALEKQLAGWEDEGHYKKKSVA
jgi:hypothetical protein